MKRYAFLGCTALTLIAATPASAQVADEVAGRSADARATDIVVTATRREERLQDVPLAVTALSADTLRTRGVSSVMDLGSSLPGVVIGTLQGTEVSLVIFIRGFGAGDASQGTQDMPVALYLDGVNIPRSQVSGIDLVTPERIEVLRGPQGQLFGRNAHSGAVQIVSKRPSGEWGGDFSAGFGTYSTKQAKGRLDLPEIAGFKVQLSGNFRQHDGYMKNVYNPLLANATIITDPASGVQFKNMDLNGDFFALKTYGGRIAVERDFGNLNAFYSYDNTWARDDQGYHVLARSSDTSPTIFNGFSATQLGPLVFSNFSGPGGTAVSFTQPIQGSEYPKTVHYSVPRIPFINKGHGHILNLTYSASDSLTLRSITGQRSISRKGGNVLDAPTSNFFAGQYEYIASDMFSQELQAIYTTNKLNITAGALYFKEDVIHEITSTLAFNCALGPAANASCAPGTSQATNVPTASAFGPANFKRSLSKTEAYGLYAQGTYTLGPVELTAGVRYSNDTKNGARVIDRRLGIDVPNGIGVARRNRFHTSRVDPAFTAKYNFNENVNAYVRYAVGYRDGGSSVRSEAFTAFAEDEIRSWEVGFKSQLFDRRLTLNVAAFDNTLSGQQLSIQEDAPRDPALTNFINAPSDRKIKGFEVEASAIVLPGLTLSGNYTYLKSKNFLAGYDFGTLATFVPQATFSPQTGIVPSAATIAAHPNSQLLLMGTIGTPRHSVSANLDYVLPIGGSNVLLHFDWTKTSKYVNSSPDISKTQIVAGKVTVLPAYNGGVTLDRANARVSFRDIPLGGGTATGEFSLWVKNIFDHVDPALAFTSGINSPTILMPPRTMGAEFRVKF